MRGDAEAREDKSIQSVQVAMRLLEVLARGRGPMGVTELALRLGMPKPRVHRHLRTLLAQGYVDQDPETEKYRAGIRLFELGRAAGEQIDLLTEARRVMQRLCDRFHLAVTLGRPVDDGIFIVDMLRADTPMEISTRPGYTMPFHASAQGKLALAFGPPELAAHVLAAPLEGVTARTIRDPARLRAEVAEARQNGWAAAPSEVLPGVNALAAPIFGVDGRLAATLTVVGTAEAMPDPPDPAMVAALVEGAAAVSRALGYRDPAATPRRAFA